MNGKPVPINARDGSVIVETEIGWPARRAPPPAVAVNSSPVAAFSTTPAITLAINHGGDRNRIPRKAVQEVRRAVERIGDEDQTIERLEMGRSLLGDEAGVGMSPANDVGRGPASESRSTSLTKSARDFISQTS